MNIKENVDTTKFALFESIEWNYGMCTEKVLPLVSMNLSLQRWLAVREYIIF